MFDLWIFISWLLLSIVVGVYAGNKGRSVSGFIILSLILSPLIGFAFAAVAENTLDKEVYPNSTTHKKCPFCAESILKDAKKCKHCMSMIDSQH